RFTINATDGDIVSGVADTLNYSIVSGSISGMSLNSSTGEFSWTPTESEDGQYVVVFGVKDNHNLAATEQTVTITVEEVNDSPDLANPGNKAVAEKSALTFSLAATDGDIVAGTPDTVSYSILLGSVAGMSFN